MELTQKRCESIPVLIHFCRLEQQRPAIEVKLDAVDIVAIQISRDDIFAILAHLRAAIIQCGPLPPSDPGDGFTDTKLRMFDPELRMPRPGSVMDIVHAHPDETRHSGRAGGRDDLSDRIGASLEVVSQVLVQTPFAERLVRGIDALANMRLDAQVVLEPIPEVQIENVDVRVAKGPHRMFQQLRDGGWWLDSLKRNRSIQVIHQMMVVAIAQWRPETP